LEKQEETELQTWFCRSYISILVNRVGREM